MIFKNAFPQFFGRRHTFADSLQRGGEGVSEKLFSSIGQYMDEDMIPLIEHLVPRLFDPLQVVNTHYANRKESLGDNFLVTKDVAKNKVTLIRHLKEWQKYRTTQRMYELMFKHAGFSAEFRIKNFPQIFDGENGIFDDVLDFNESGDPLPMPLVNQQFDADDLIYYCIVLYSHHNVLTDNDVHCIFSIIKFNHPVGCKLLGVYHNDLEVQLYPVIQYKQISDMYISFDCSYSL